MYLVRTPFLNLRLNNVSTEVPEVKFTSNQDPTQKMFTHSTKVRRGLQIILTRLGQYLIDVGVQVQFCLLRTYLSFWVTLSVYKKFYLFRTQVTPLPFNKILEPKPEPPVSLRILKDIRTKIWNRRVISMGPPKFFYGPDVESSYSSW